MKTMLIGVGWHSQNNIIPALEIVGVEIVAIATRDLKKSQDACNKYAYGAVGYDDYLKMLGEVDCENVVIVTQGADAVEIVKNCLKAKKHIFVEKPCGMNSVDAKEIRDLVKDNSVSLHVGFMKRFADGYLKMKELINNHSVRSFRLSFNVSASRFCHNDFEYFYFVGIHMIDLLVYLFGDIEVNSVIKNDEGDGASYQLLLTSGSIVGSCSFENRSAHTQESEVLEVTFEDGNASVVNLEEFSYHKASDSNYQSLSEEFVSYKTTYNPASGYRRDLYLRGFVGEINSFVNHGVDMSDSNLRVNEICDKILELLR